MSAMRGQLLTLAQQSLVAANTAAGANVYLGRTWPLTSIKLPAIAVDWVAEGKDDVTRGNGVPHFVTVSWLELRVALEATSPEDLVTARETLVDQVELVLMGIIIDPNGYRRIVRGEYKSLSSTEGESHMGEVTMTVGFEFTEIFQPVITDPLQGIDVTATDGPGGATLATATIDLPTS